LDKDVRGYNYCSHGYNAKENSTVHKKLRFEKVADTLPSTGTELVTALIIFSNQLFKMFKETFKSDFIYLKSKYFTRSFVLI
tara:strand:- start:54 stop:299 length:246 start_codon:yes stop_codon:yes gene_type:complete